MSANSKVVTRLLGVIVVMSALAWGSVPFYDWFCRVTGFGGTTQVASGDSEVILDQTIRVRFDASLAHDMPWEFRAMQPHMDIRIGETGLAFYEAYNPTDRVIAGSASYNVFPYEAGGFFSKIQCFCFEEQVLQPGERVQMPVTFFVDQAIVMDMDAKYVHTITLSYTFYEIDLPESQAALDQATDTTLN